MTLLPEKFNIFYWTVKYMYEIKLVPFGSSSKIKSAIWHCYPVFCKKKKKKVNYRPLFLISRDIYFSSQLKV
jgi:hypothetical protein